VILDTEHNVFSVRYGKMAKPRTEAVPFPHLRDARQELRVQKQDLVLESLKSSHFRGLRSRDTQIPHLRRPPCQLTFQLIANLFHMSKSGVGHLWRKFEERETTLASGQDAPIQPRAPNALLLAEEEAIVIVSIGERQRQGDCPCPREVRDFAGNLFERRTHQERVFTTDWWRCFRSRHGAEISLSIAAGKETARTQVTTQAVPDSFDEVAKVLPTCATPNQILNMGATGLAFHLMKERK
jgi:hypothetical protein